MESYEEWEERVCECLYIENTDGEIIIKCVMWMNISCKIFLWNLILNIKYVSEETLAGLAARVWWSEGRCNMIKILQILQKYSIIVLLSDAGLGTVTAVWKSCLQHNLVLFSNLCLLIYCWRVKINIANTSRQTK